MNENLVKKWNSREIVNTWVNHYNSNDFFSLRNITRNNGILKLFTSLCLDKNHSILELAYGPGYISKEVYKQGFNISGIDISSEFQKIVSEACKQMNKTNVFDFKAGDVNSLPYENKSFDCVIGSGFLQYQKDPVICLKGAFRVLKPGGYCIIGQRNVLSLRHCSPFKVLLYYLGAKNEIIWKDFLRKDRIIKKAVYPKILKKWLVQAGFEVLSVNKSFGNVIILATKKG